MKVKLEGKGNAMFIYSKKSYIWFLEDGSLVLKGSPFKSRLKFYLPKCISDVFLDLLNADEEERYHIIAEEIRNAEFENLLTHISTPLYRLVGKDIQTVKRALKHEKKYGLVRTTWDDIPRIYLKRCEPHQWQTPVHLPLIKLIYLNNGVLDLREYSGLTIIEAIGYSVLKDTPLEKYFGNTVLLLLDDGIYSISIRNMSYLISQKGELIEVPTSKSQDILGGVLVGLKCQFNAKKVNVKEEQFRDIILSYAKEILKRMKLGVKVDWKEREVPLWLS